MSETPLHLTEETLKKSTIGIYPTITLLVIVAGAAWWGADFLSDYKDETTAAQATLTSQLQMLQNDIAVIRQNQAEGQQRAEQRQQDTTDRIDNVVVVNRARNDAIESRLRPVETGLAAQGATLSSLNQNVIQLGADSRENQRMLQQILQKLSAEDDRP